MRTNIKSAPDFSGHEFVITREFAAPRELVFKAWTDPKHLAQWWGPKGFTNPVCEWDARPGGKIYDVMRAPNGTDYPMGGEFREIVPPGRLVLMCGALNAGGNFLFEFLHTATFTERNGKTTLTLNSRVIKTTAEANKYIGGFETGMTLSLERLANLVQTNEPLVIERIINAPAERVWQALTTKEEMGRWFFELEEFKAKAGFAFGFAVEHEGFTYVHHCKVMEAVPNQKLAFTWRYEGQAGDSLVTIELFAAGSQTRVKLTHTGLETFPAVPAFARVNFMGGWTCIIGSALGDFVENADREIVIAREFNAPYTVAVENGSGVLGIGTMVVNRLAGLNVNLPAVRNAASFNYNVTQILAGAKAFGVANQVRGILGRGVVLTGSGLPDTTVVVIVGKDLKAKDLQ